MKKKYWITRDKGDCLSASSDIIFLWDYKNKPKKEIKNIVIGDNNIIYYLEGYGNMYFSISNFKKLYGFTPRKGTCELIELDLNVDRKLIEL